MSLPPRWYGDRRDHAVVVDEHVGAWSVLVDGRVLAGGFGSERDARVAADAEALRLEATAHALLRRIRRGLRRKLR